MKATFTINQLQFELSAESAKDLFQQVAQAQEIFEAEISCGCCQSEHLRYSYREAGDYKFYEIVCRDCGAKFSFGQKKQGGALFPKRTDNGKPLPNGGWAKYVPGDHDEDSQRSATRPAARPAAAQASGVVPDFPDWDVAEKSDQFARAKPLRVGGQLFHTPSGKRQYELAPERFQGAAK